MDETSVNMSVLIFGWLLSQHTRWCRISKQEDLENHIWIIITGMFDFLIFFPKVKINKVWKLHSSGKLKNPENGVLICVEVSAQPLQEYLNLFHPNSSSWLWLGTQDVLHPIRGLLLRSWGDCPYVPLERQATACLSCLSARTTVSLLRTAAEERSSRTALGDLCTDSARTMSINWNIELTYKNSSYSPL